MKMLKLARFTACLALISALCSSYAQQEDNPVSSTSKIVEEKTTVETRRVYETKVARPAAARKTAIFIDNRAGPQHNDKVLLFEDQVTSRVAGKDFAIISREEVVKALKSYRGADVVQNTQTGEAKGNLTLNGQADVTATTDQHVAAVGSAAAFPQAAVVGARADAQVSRQASGSYSGQASLGVDASGTRTSTHEIARSDAARNTLGTKADQALTDGTSALRLAQNMGADFILCVTIGSIAKETRNFNDPSIGVSAKTIVHTLRGTYKVLEGVTGSTLGGGPFRESKTIRQSDTLQIDDQDALNELIESAAAEIADGMAAKAANFVPPPQSAQVGISIACGVKDLEGNEITLPDIRLTENNTVVKGDQALPVQASATIEIDGFAMGTTPALIKVAPGAHKLRLSRAGFEPVELTINAIEGLSLTPTLQLSRDGFNRWKEIRSFLNRLDNNRKITDAVAEDIRGHAQMLRQSGIRIDTTNAPTIIKKNSIFGQDNY